MTGDQTERERAQIRPPDAISRTVWGAEVAFSLTPRKTEENTRKTHISRSPRRAVKSCAIKESYVQGGKLSVVRFFTIHFSSFCVKTCCGPPFLLQPSKSVGSLNKRQNSAVCWSSARTRTRCWTHMSHVA